MKSNRLVEASYRLTLAEQRIVLLAITDARRTQTGLNEANELEIRATDYAETFNIPENQAYEQVKEASHTLFHRYVILRGVDPKTGKEDKLTVRWVSSVRYVDGAGTLYLRFAHDMVPYITRLEKEFTRYRLEIVASMSSPYAIRLYELLIQWGSIGQREIEVEWLKKALMVDRDYPRMFDFKKRVIDVALAQVNEHSDLDASYTQRKTGRNVTHLIFEFSPKSNFTQEKEVAQPPKPSFLDPDGKSPFRLAKAPIPPDTQAKYLKVRTGEEIELCIERANEYGEQEEKAGKPVRYGALYRKAIEEGWHEEKARQKAEQAEDAVRKEISRQRAAEAKRAEEKKSERTKTEMELSAEWFAALLDDEKKAMGSAFVAESNPFDVGSFKRKGYDYTGFRLFVKRTWLESKKR